MSKQIKWALVVLVLIFIPVSAQKLKIAGRVTTPGNGIFYLDCEILEEGSYGVQRAESVTSRFWTTITNFTALPGKMTVQEPMAGPGRYYRLVRFTNAPAISIQPQGLTNNAGAEIRLTATATGSAPLRLQWFKDGQPLNAATSSNLVFAAQTSLAGGYTLVASNPWGKATSQVAQVRILATAAPSLAGKTVRFTLANNVGNYTTVFNAQGFYNTTGSSPLLNDTGYWLYSVLGDSTARIILPGSITYPDGQVTLTFQDAQNGTYSLVVPGQGGSQAGQFQILN